MAIVVIMVMIKMAVKLLVRMVMMVKDSGSGSQDVWVLT